MQFPYSFFNIAATSGGFIVATGGNSTWTSGNIKYHWFSSGGTFSVSSGVGGATYALWGGGGGGGGGVASNVGGGGGAGEYVISFATLSVGDYGIVIGSGGAGGTDRDTPGSNGVTTSFGSIRHAAGGGGGGGGHSDVAGTFWHGQDGGSGGGQGDARPNPARVGFYGAATAVSPGVGNNGGSVENTVLGVAAAGGGGGAGAIGNDGTSLGTPHGGNGGAGVTDAITGNVICGGGGGAVSGTEIVGSGGNGGGGNGGMNNTPAQAGATNSGGGGGGGCEQGSGSQGAAGGSGGLVVSYTYQ